MGKYNTTIRRRFSEVMFLKLLLCYALTTKSVCKSLNLKFTLQKLIDGIDNQNTLLFYVMTSLLPSYPFFKLVRKLSILKFRPSNKLGTIKKDIKYNDSRGSIPFNCSST